MALTNWPHLKTNNMTKHLIIGGGINGLMTAYFLAKDGHTVTLIERGDIGQEASWAGGGILAPLYPWRYPQAVTDLVQLSQRQYPPLLAELQQLSGIDSEHLPSGLLILDAENHDEAMDWATRTGTVMQRVDRQRIQQIAPNIQTENTSALWMPEVGQVRNPRLVKALHQAVIKLGVEIREHCEVLDLAAEQCVIRGVNTQQGYVAAQNIAICCGAWSAKLLSALDTAPPIIPVRGQMLLFKADPTLLDTIILNQGHYAIPRKDGHILFGSTLEYVGFDKQVTSDAYAELLETAHRLIPALAGCSIERHWAGLRPGSPQGIPSIGRHPHIQGLFINAGQFRNGVVMAPASARLLADLMRGHAPQMDATTYAP